MFDYISGKLALLDPGFAVVDAGGVGYRLTITQTTYDAMPPPPDGGGGAHRQTVHLHGGA